MSYKHRVYPGNVISGVLVTADAILGSKSAARPIFKASGALANDMESFGMAQVCYQNHVKFAILRAITDPFNTQMYKALVKPVAANLQRFTLVYLKYLSKA